MRTETRSLLAAASAALTLAGCSSPGRRRVPSRFRARRSSIARCCPSRSRNDRLYSELDARNAKPPPRFEVKAPRRRTQRRDRADRRHRLRRAQHVRRSHPHADHGPAGPGRPALQQLPHHGAVLADAQRAQDRAQPPHRQYRLDHGELDGLPWQHRARIRTASRPWRKCCGSTATAPVPSASGTRPPRGRPACRARSTAGRPTRVSTSSTDSSAVRPTSGIRSSTTA